VLIKPRVKGQAITPIESVWDAEDGGLIIPPNFIPVGLITKADGSTWSRSTTVADTESAGYAEPTRRDVTGDVRGLRFTAQESNRATLALYESLPADQVKQIAGGAVTYDAPARPGLIEYEVLAIAQDGVGADVLHQVRYLPRATMTEFSDQRWSEDGEWLYPCNFGAMVDPNAGTSLRTWWCGSEARLEGMGFDPAGGTP
jgi:hypothetical protein